MTTSELETIVKRVLYKKNLSIKVGKSPRIVSVQGSIKLVFTTFRDKNKIEQLEDEASDAGYKVIAISVLERSVPDLVESMVATEIQIRLREVQNG